ncbi:histidinol phosphatase [Microthyrium microscopicum]|uniref:Histidinol-phosphatase n=1 Tax=Microthyrium microscopicum TaxID=703497 RepID=A0A6A6UQV8_9PEZI|nr:histidinol phosphatase [Microthyrium microscopicum]
MVYSHHSHSGQFCMHAKGNLEEMVQAAIARGMSTYALTEHMPRDIEDLYPEEVSAISKAEQFDENIDAFYEEAVRLREQYKANIKILIGFESEWIRKSSVKLIESLQSKYPWDFFVGSVHHVKTVPIDFNRPTYETARVSAGGTDVQLFESYFDAQYEMIQAIKPPIIGHFDLIKLLSDHPNENMRQWDSVWSKVERNLKAISEYGGVVEINSSALRKGLIEPYPSMEMCRTISLTENKTFLGLGGQLCLSDDAHTVEQVGTNYSKVFNILEAAGIEQLVYFSDKDWSSMEVSTLIEKWDQREAA